MKEKLLTPLSVVSTKIKKIREDFSLTQAQLADILNVNSTNVVAIEAGRQGISANSAIRLNRRLSVNINWLLCDVGKPYLGDKKMTNKEKASVSNIVKYLQNKDELIDNLRNQLDILRKENELLRQMKPT